MKTISSRQFVIDSDMGTDDAAAIAWLLTQSHRPLDVLGLCAVWGNSSVENAAGNMRALLGTLRRRNTPVLMGEDKPLHGKRSTIGALLHGRDGLWGHGRSSPKNQFDTDLVGFYKKLTPQLHDATLLTLGPLTNVARVLEADPALLRGFSRVIILGGSYRAGGMTPTAETNIWYDPHAAKKVLSSGLPVTLVTRDAHTMFSLSMAEIEQIATSAHPAAPFLAGPLRAYAIAQTKYAPAVHCADVVAAMIAVDPSLATTMPKALVKVVTADEPLVYGQTVMGFSPFEKIPMLESIEKLESLMQRHMTDSSFDLDQALGAILVRAPDNANVVLAIDADRIKPMFLRTMTAPVEG